MNFQKMIRNAIKTKIVKSIEKWKIFQSLIRRIDKRIICAVIFGLCFVWKIQTLNFIHAQRIFVGWILCVNLFTFFDTVVSGFLKIWKLIPHVEFIQPKENEPKDAIDGFEKSDLISFLLDQKWFPFMNAKMKFGMSPKDFKKIGDNLERVGVLVRGENNARILNKNVTRDVLEKIFACSNSDDMFAPLLRDGNSFTVQKL